MYAIFRLLLLLVAASVAVVDGAKAGAIGKSLNTGDVLIGARVKNDKMIYSGDIKEIERLGGIVAREMLFPQPGEFNNLEINRIEIIQNLGLLSGGRAYITNGGTKARYVSVEFKSGIGTGLDYHIRIFGYRPPMKGHD